MKINTFVVGAAVTLVSACSSSPPELPEPQGEWISANSVLPPVRQQTNQTQLPSSINVPPPLTTLNKPAPAKVAVPADASLHQFVASDGRNMPLYEAVRSIVPTHWGVSLSSKVAPRIKQKISWTGNDEWPFVLRKALAPHGLLFNVDEKRQLVTVMLSDEAAQSTTSALPKAGAASGERKPVDTTTVMASQTKTKSLLTVTPTSVAQPNANKPLKLAGMAEAAKNPPLQGASLTQPSPGLSKPGNSSIRLLKNPPVLTATAPLLTAKKEQVVPVPVPVPVRSWNIPAGTTLKAGFLAWVSKEICPANNGKWMVKWDVDVDYPIDVPLHFKTKDFVAATNELFDLYKYAKAPLYVGGYLPQCLIVITDKKDQLQNLK